MSNRLFGLNGEIGEIMKEGRTLVWFSPVDEGKQHCRIHDVEMKPILPIIYHNEGIYGIGDDFDCLCCPECMKAMNADIGSSDAGLNICTTYVKFQFDDWDEGQIDIGMFRFIKEGTIEDAFEESEDGIVISKDGEQSFDKDSYGVDKEFKM